eukprot:TRINITY_DN16289_c0_g1_i1.p1 TRINITY_DN16289_c0_g1~~TRINITY_DN16289_c0_g1_i1.p1  ORF type:complete len:515 (+),score=109.08 TRINITY_DN16289_c0_g1_i1:170-1546(+)
MSVLPKECVQVLAELSGIAVLSDDVATALVADVEFRLRDVLQDAIKVMQHSKRSTLTTEDVNDALRMRNADQLYGYGGNDKGLTFRRAAGSSELYFVEDKEIPLSDVFARPLPKCPLDTTFSAHWLSIEGVQPATRHNPPPKEDLVTVGKKRKDKSGHVKDLVKHAMSQELQLYYEKVTSAVIGESEELRTAALQSLASDPGIHQLLPYFTQFVCDQVTHNLRNLSRLRNAMRMVAALLESEHIQIELYLHQLMPAILTCIVGRWLCKTPDENHWELREHAADIAATVCSRFGVTYANLQPRVTKTLLHAFLDPRKPLTTQYGAITGLARLGPSVTQLLILPNLAPYLKILTPAMECDDEEKANEARKCYDALLMACGNFLRDTLESARETAATVKKHEGGEEVDGEAKKGRADVKQVLSLVLPGAEDYYRLLRDTFGDRLTPYLGGVQGQALADIVL